MIRLAISVLLAASLPAVAEAADAEFICQPTSKYICTPERGCEAGVVSVWAEFTANGPGSAIYQRCDRKGCDKYTATTYSSGEFLVIEVPGRTSFAKVGPDGAWTESVSIGNNVIVAQGKCSLNGEHQQ